MQPKNRRRVGVVAAAALLGSLLYFLLPFTPASAGTQTNNNACLSNATATYSDLPWTLSGTDTPDPATLGGGDVTLSGGSVQVDIPATLLVAGYNLGLLTVGPNNIPTDVYVSRSASNATGVAPATGASPAVQVDNFNTVAVTTITDPDGIPGTGDETATPLNVNEPLPNIVVTPTGGSIDWQQGPNGSIGQLPPGVGSPGGTLVNGSLFATASVAGGLVRANFDCFVGTTNIDPPGGTSGPTFTPAPTIPFETTTVTAPPTAPVCTDESVSVGAGQTTTIDLTDNCTDVNGNIDPSTYAVSALTPASPAGGTLTPTATPGVYSYEAPGTDPGPVTFTFTVADTGGLVSNTATATIAVLANQCDATTGPCELTEIVVQPVIGTTMTMDKAPGFVVMTPVVLNGQAQVSSGNIQPVVVTNARGTAAGWSVTGYVTDLGAPGSPTISPLPGVTIPACSPEGSLGLQPAPDRLCIPGDNMGWAPNAQVTHDQIYGDVASVNAGAADAADAASWLAQLIAANGSRVDGIGGLQEANELCSANTNTSGGTFQCDASLFLGVPASAGAGDYTGGLVLTLT
jgi:hypothetical protein